MNRPQPDEYGAFTKKYIEIADVDVFGELNSQLVEVPQLLRAISAGKRDYAYASGKWTVKELLGHVIDTERIMAYRLLCFARNDSTELPGFEEDDYVLAANFSDRDFEDLIKEFEAVRRANLFLINSLREEDLNRAGKAGGNPFSVRALLFVLAGHLKHHINILKERYLKD